MGVSGKAGDLAKPLWRALWPCIYAHLWPGLPPVSVDLPNGRPPLMRSSILCRWVGSGRAVTGAHVMQEFSNSWKVFMELPPRCLLLSIPGPLVAQLRGTAGGFCLCRDGGDVAIPESRGVRGTGVTGVPLNCSSPSFQPGFVFTSLHPTMVSSQLPVPVVLSSPSR